MMATSPLFSATITTSHLRWTYIGALSEYSLHSATTRTTCILIIVITNQHHVLSTAAQPQPHHAPHTFHVPGQSHRACTSLEVMSLGHHKDLRGFTSASFGTIRNTSLLVICSFYLLSSEFRRRCQVRSRARRWLQLVGCAALLLDASNSGGPDGVGESGVEPRRSLRRRERVKEK